MDELKYNTCSRTNRKMNKRLILQSNLSWYILRLSRETRPALSYSLLYSGHKCESVSLCFRGFGQQIIPSSRAKDEEENSLIFAEESWSKAPFCHLNRTGSKEQTLSPHFSPRLAFTVVCPHWPPQQTKASMGEKNWPISTQAKWDLGIFAPYRLIIHLTNAEVWEFSQEPLNFPGQSQRPPGQGKGVKRCKNCSTDNERFVCIHLLGLQFLSHSGTSGPAWKPNNLAHEKNSRIILNTGSIRCVSSTLKTSLRPRELQKQQTVGTVFV